MALQMDLETSLQGLSDTELNKFIKELVEARCDHQDMSGERAEFQAICEWRRRYPGTIAPCIYQRTVNQGGFPSCYQGPMETVDIED